jgi:hypothetical protein
VKRGYAGTYSKKFKFKFENTGCKRGYRVTWCPDELSIKDGQKTLGVMKCPSSSQAPEIDRLRGKSDGIARRVALSSLSYNAIFINDNGHSPTGHGENTTKGDSGISV